MKMKGLVNLKKSVFVFLVFISFFAFSCQDGEILSNDNPNSEIPAGEDPVIDGEVLKEFTVDELLSMKSHLDTNGIETSDLDFSQDEVSSRGKISSVLLRAIKVTTKSPHSADPTKLIDLSGVILVPKYSFTPLRLVVAPVPTFTANAQAPSNLFKNSISLMSDGLLNYLYFWSLEAYKGFAVLLPDYPGFGDSYQQCFPPYVVQKPMVNSTIDITKAAQKVLKNNGYRYKSDIIITGYSQGAFVATSTARELELNPSHGLNVSLLVAGGTPANLRYMIDTALEVGQFQPGYLLPYAACGFKRNGYPDIVFSDIFKEPYASNLYSYFDGTHTDLSTAFPAEITDLYTEDIINNWTTSSKYALIRNAVDQNNIQPWKNRCRMIMVHGHQDVTVHYENARDFASRQNLMGGDVIFKTVYGDHLTSVVNYYIWASNTLLLYR